MRCTSKKKFSTTLPSCHKHWVDFSVLPKQITSKCPHDYPTHGGLRGLCYNSLKHRHGQCCRFHWNFLGRRERRVMKRKRQVGIVLSGSGYCSVSLLGFLSPRDSLYLPTWQPRTNNHEPQVPWFWLFKSFFWLHIFSSQYVALQYCFIIILFFFFLHWVRKPTTVLLWDFSVLVWIFWSPIWITSNYSQGLMFDIFIYIYILIYMYILASSVATKCEKQPLYYQKTGISGEHVKLQIRFLAFFYTLYLLLNNYSLQYKFIKTIFRWMDRVRFISCILV